MQVLSGSNAVYSSADSKLITLDIVTDTYGAIPITVHPDDPPTAQIYADCLTGKYGAIAPYPVEKARGVGLIVIEQAYTAANAAPISYMSTTFQADDASQALMAQVLTALAGTTPPNFAWWDMNNVGVPMTNAQLAGLAQAILLRGQGYFAHKQALKAAIRAAADVATVQAVTW